MVWINLRILVINTMCVMASIFRFLFRINKSEYGNIWGSAEMSKSVFWQGWKRKKHIVVACFHFWKVRESDFFETYRSGLKINLGKKKHWVTILESDSKTIAEKSCCVFSAGYSRRKLLSKKKLFSLLPTIYSLTNPRNLTPPPKQPNS